MADLGCSYFGGFDPEGAKRDFEDMRSSGFSWVVLPLTEEDTHFRDGIFTDLVRSARDAGLEAWISPWGVAGVFGGEGLTTLPAVCPRSCTFRDVLDRWLHVAWRAAPDAIMWDEPRSACCPSEAVLALAMRDTRAARIDNHVCFLPGRPWPTYDSPEQGAGPLLRGIGVGPEHAPHPERDRLGHLAGAYDALAAYADAFSMSPELHLWVQAFRVPREGEHRTVELLDAALRLPVHRVGVWAYQAGRNVGALRCEDTFSMWNRVLTVVHHRERITA